MTRLFDAVGMTTAGDLTLFWKVWPFANAGIKSDIILSFCLQECGELVGWVE